MAVTQKQLDIILRNYRVIILEWKGLLKSFRPIALSAQVKKLRLRHLFKSSKPFYDSVETKIMLAYHTVRWKLRPKKGDGLTY